MGAVLAAGVVFALGCASEPDQEFMDESADHQQICVEISQDGQQLERVDDDDCPSDEDNNGQSTFYPGYPYWYYLGRAYGSPPPVGQRLPLASHGSFSRPQGGTIARPPATGGFGTTRVSVGS